GLSAAVIDIGLSRLKLRLLLFQRALQCGRVELHDHIALFYHRARASQLDDLQIAGDRRRRKLNGFQRANFASNLQVIYEVSPANLGSGNRRSGVTMEGESGGGEQQHGRASGEEHLSAFIDTDD